MGMGRDRTDGTSVWTHPDTATLVGRALPRRPNFDSGIGDVSSWHNVARIAGEKSRQSGNLLC
jgi:hypothetical protein